MKKLLAVLLTGVMCMGLTSCDNEKEDVDDEEEIVEHDVDDEETDDEDDTSDKSYKEKDEKKSVDSDWEYIKDKGVINVGVTDFYPLNYRDSNGEWIGFDTEFAQAVGKKLGIDVEFVEISWDEKETELASKNIDCIWNGLVLTDEKKDVFRFTDAYMSDEPVLFAKTTIKNLKDVSGKRIVVVEGSVGEKTIAEHFENNECISVASTEIALEYVDYGEADVAVVSSVDAYGLTEVKNGIFEELESTHMGYDKVFYAVAFRKDSDACEKINEAIKSLKKNGELEKIAREYGLSNCLAD